MTSFMLFCEGAEQGLDIQLLDRLMEGDLASATIEPCGSKNGMLAYASGFVGHKIETDNTPIPYLCLRDRDFDYFPQGQGELIPTHREHLFCLGLGSIENYLLDGDLLSTFLANYKKDNRHKPSTKSFDDSPAAIKACMISAAKSIRFYQAARWTIKKCRDNQSLIRTSWIGKDDKLPAKLDDSYNLDQVKHHLSSHFQPLTTEQHIAEVYSEFVKLFSPDAFYESFEYRKWFHGKNLLAGLSRVLPLRGQNDI